MTQTGGEKGLTNLHRKILSVLERHPEGISLNAIAIELGIDLGKQMHFNRRFRDLYKSFEIEKKRIGTETLYLLKGRRSRPLDDAPITKTLRAAVLHAARGRCGMCGRTITGHGVKLAVDHKIPRAWGGKTEMDNLWALCSTCNEGKRDFFASIDSPAMRAAINHDSVHVRIGELLKAYGGAPVPSPMLDVVAGQSDWMKRLRELRYLDWEIAVTKKKLASGRVESAYRLVRSAPWPPDPTGTIRAYEIERSRRNRNAR